MGLNAGLAGSSKHIASMTPSDWRASITICRQHGEPLTPKKESGFGAVEPPDVMGSAIHLHLGRLHAQGRKPHSLATIATMSESVLGIRCISELGFDDILNYD